MSKCVAQYVLDKRTDHILTSEAVYVLPLLCENLNENMSNFFQGFYSGLFTN